MMTLRSPDAIRGPYQILGSAVAPVIVVFRSHVAGRSSIARIGGIATWVRVWIGRWLKEWRLLQC